MKRLSAFFIAIITLDLSLSQLAVNCGAAFAESDAALQQPANVSHKTFDHLPNLEIPGDGKGTTVSNVVVSIDRGVAPGTVVYSLDYDFYNHGEGDKAGSSNTVILFDFVGKDGRLLPGPPITSTNFRNHCTRPGAEHRHETGLLNEGYLGFFDQASSIAMRDTGIQGYAGGCGG